MNDFEIRAMYEQVQQMEVKMKALEVVLNDCLDRLGLERLARLKGEK